MSFGASPGDLVMAAKYLVTLAKTLKSEATDHFRHYADRFKMFAKLAKRMNNTIQGSDHLRQDPDIRDLQGDVEDSLLGCFSKIKEFKPFLWRRGGVPGLRRAIAKVRWTSQKGSLEQLHKDLKSKLGVLNMTITLSTWGRLRSSPPRRTTLVTPVLVRMDWLAVMSCQEAAADNVHFSSSDLPDLLQTLLCFKHDGC